MLFEQVSDLREQIEKMLAGGSEAQAYGGYVNDYNILLAQAKTGYADGNTILDELQPFVVGNITVAGLFYHSWKLLKGIEDQRPKRRIKSF